MQESIEELKAVVDKLLRMPIGGYTPGSAALPEIGDYTTPTQIRQRAITEEGVALRNSISLLGHYIDGFTAQKTQAVAAFSVPRAYYPPKMKIDPVSVVVDDIVTLEKWQTFIAEDRSHLNKLMDLTLTSEARDLATSQQHACENIPVDISQSLETHAWTTAWMTLDKRLRCILYSVPLELPAELPGESRNYIQTLCQSVMKNVNTRKQHVVKATPSFEALADVITCNTFSRIVLSIYEASSGPTPREHFWVMYASFNMFLQAALDTISNAVTANKTLQDALDVVQGMLFHRDDYQAFAKVLGIEAKKVGSISAINKHSGDLKRAFDWILSYQLLHAYFWQRCSIINRRVFDQAPDISWYNWMMFVSAVVCIDEEVVKYLNRITNEFDTKEHIYKTEEQNRCIDILRSLLQYADIDDEIAEFQTRLAVYTNVRIVNTVLHTLQIGAVYHDELGALRDLLNTVKLDGRAHKLSNYLLEKLLRFDTRIAYFEKENIRQSVPYSESLQRYREKQSEHTITEAQNNMRKSAGYG